MELVDMQDLGSCVERRVGSSPFIRTNSKKVATKSPKDFVAIFLYFFVFFYSLLKGPKAFNKLLHAIMSKD